MSYTDEVINELLQADISKTCCRKALLFGLMYGASRDGDRGVTAFFRNGDIAERAAYILKKQFSAEPQVTALTRAGRRVFSVSASTKAIAGFLDSADSADSADTGGRELSELVGFRCPACSQTFLRGVFIATATISDPQKSYHLEFSLPRAERANKLSQLLVGDIMPTGRVERNGKIGIYYKKNVPIGDLLYYVGATKKGFELSNDFATHTLRNIVNRTTNCESGNLARVVDAAVKQIKAINALQSEDMLRTLGEDICYTAELRLANPEISLTELAKLHEPPISRSMLNRRLAKIIKKYEDIK